MKFLNRGRLTEKGISYSPAHLRRLESAGQFPCRVQLGENRVAWIEAEIEDWYNARASAREAA